MQDPKEKGSETNREDGLPNEFQMTQFVNDKTSEEKAIYASLQQQSQEQMTESKTLMPYLHLNDSFANRA